MPSGKPETLRVTETGAALGTMRGSTEAGTPKSSHIESSHVLARRFMSSVREAFVTSVT
jgi:hypothetical protein